MCDCDHLISYRCLYHAKMRGVQWVSRSHCLKKYARNKLGARIYDELVYTLTYEKEKING